jgi:hypothetical protein
MEVRMDRKPTVLLEAWQLIAPSSLPPRLTGLATGHPHLPGFRRHVATSHVIRIDHVEREAETLNTVYRLRRRLSNTQVNRDDPTGFSLCHLRAERQPEAGTWIVRNDQLVLAAKLPSAKVAILTMLLSLDLEGFDDTKS